MYRHNESEYTIALDAATGKTIWEVPQDAKFLPGMDMQYGPGPHATPRLVGGRLFSVGILGSMLSTASPENSSGPAIFGKNLEARSKGAGSP
jgi:hypothetical protein